MKLSDSNNKTLMLALHQKIEEYADYYAEKLHLGETNDLLIYPPNCGMTDDELHALVKLGNDLDLKSALRKILASSSAGVIFDLMNFIDGTSDPEDKLGDWTEIAFVDKSDDIEPPDDMLHDNFFSTYWDWKDIRPDTGWTLDIDDE